MVNTPEVTPRLPMALRNVGAAKHWNQSLPLRAAAAG